MHSIDLQRFWSRWKWLWWCNIVGPSVGRSFIRSHNQIFQFIFDYRWLLCLNCLLVGWLVGTTNTCRFDDFLATTGCCTFNTCGPTKCWVTAHMFCSLILFSGLTTKHKLELEKKKFWKLPQMLIWRDGIRTRNSKTTLNDVGVAVIVLVVVVDNTNTTCCCCFGYFPCQRQQEHQHHRHHHCRFSYCCCISNKRINECLRAPASPVCFGCRCCWPTWLCNSLACDGETAEIFI